MRAAFIFSVAIVCWLASLASATVSTDVVFKVGTNSSIDWFEINNPSVGGTITVANQPYAHSQALNAAAVDIATNQLIYDAYGPAYGISLTGLTLVPNTATVVSVASLGTWPNGDDNAGYSKTTGLVYYHVYGSDVLQYLNFNTDGTISGNTTVGTLHGGGFVTPSITSGDLDVDASGNIWIAGLNSASNPRLWSFDPTTLENEANLDPTDNYSGIAFDSSGTTLYGYSTDTDQYGIINQTTGDFQTVLMTSSSLFGDAGDLTEATVSVAVPEPSFLAPLILAAGLGLARRKGAAGPR
jgi:hypothetical protein